MRFCLLFPIHLNCSMTIVWFGCKILLIKRATCSKSRIKLLLLFFLFWGCMDIFSNFTWLEKSKNWWKYVFSIYTTSSRQDINNDSMSLMSSLLLQMDRTDQKVGWHGSVGSGGPFQGKRGYKPMETGITSHRHRAWLFLLVFLTNNDISLCNHQGWGVAIRVRCILKQDGVIILRLQWQITNFTMCKKRWVDTLYVLNSVTIWE